MRKDKNSLYARPAFVVSPSCVRPRKYFPGLLRIGRKLRVLKIGLSAWGRRRRREDLCVARLVVTKHAFLRHGAGRGRKESLCEARLVVGKHAFPRHRAGGRNVWKPSRAVGRHYGHLLHGHGNRSCPRGRSAGSAASR
jgi:hypothetical protein